MSNLLVIRTELGVLPYVAQHDASVSTAARAFDSTNYCTDGVRILLRGTRPIRLNAFLLFPETLEVLRTLTIAPNSWFGVTEWLNLDEASMEMYPGGSSSAYAYVYNDYVVPLHSMHICCTNCKLAIMAHEGSKCVYDSGHFSLDPIASEFIASEHAIILSTGAAVPLKEFYCTHWESPK